MRRWTRLSSQAVIDSKWLRVTADRCQVTSDRVIEPFYVIHEPEWVAIVAVNAKAEILTVRQYRYPSDAFCTELPGGVADANETFEAAARRELLEETGYVAARWAYAGPLFANPARQSNRVHIYVAQDLELVAGQSLDPNEEITCAFFSRQQIEAAIQANEFSHATHVAAYYRGLQLLGAS